MKDYFADIIPKGVTGVTKCNIATTFNNTKAYTNTNIITPVGSLKGNGCKTSTNYTAPTLHYATPLSNNGVTLEARETAITTPITPVTPDNYYVTFFEERAGIAEFDGCQSCTEAEAIAYKDTLSEWIYNNPPAGYKITHCAYCLNTIDFTVGSYQELGAVYLCHSQDNKHLRSYLQSRLNEAKTYLKSIKINQPSCEVSYG